MNHSNLKQIALLLGSSLLSSILAILMYRAVEDPQKIVIREPVSARYAHLNGDGSMESIPASPVAPFSGKVLNTPGSFVEAAAIATPAVVNIRTSSSGTYPWSRERYGSSFGSGVLISTDGYVVTNRHVIEDGTKIEVTLSDKRDYIARLVGTDPSTDLALLKIDATGLSFLSFGNSDSVTVGEWVLAVGNPFNLESTVTAGIVSAKGRNINILEDQYSIESFIQTDAAVNPGNSGGALVNTRGELIGINTAIITQSGKYEGYSFAVPANLAMKIIDDLREFGEVQRAILGVNIESIDNARALELSLPSVEGVYISRISPNGGADDAGLRNGDVIVSFNGTRVRSVPEFQEMIGRFRPGTLVNVQYFRNGKLGSARVMLKNKENKLSLVRSSSEDLLLDLGFELKELSPAELKRLPARGVRVTSIYRGSKIEQTKMDPDYIITKVNEVRVATVDEVLSELKKAKGMILLEGFYEEYAGEYYYSFSKD
jgi:Do/DeqQ family serine protease